MADMLICRFDLIGLAPISFSRVVETPRGDGEAVDVWELRTRHEKCHVDANGVYMPPTAIKNCLVDSARYLGDTVPNKGKATYTKHFEAGLLVTDPLYFGVALDDVKYERLHLPSDGKRGGGRRVWKWYPYLPTGWKTSVTLYALDPQLIGHPEVILKTAEHAGKFIGIGRFRPRNNGFYGRFSVDGFKTERTK